MVNIVNQPFMDRSNLGKCCGGSFDSVAQRGQYFSSFSRKVFKSEQLVFEELFRGLKLLLRLFVFQFEWYRRSFSFRIAVKL